MTLTHEVWKDLAGPLYDELVQDKAFAFEHLVNPNGNIRIAAINIYGSLWNGSTDPAFVNACRQIAATDPDNSVRAHAISAFGQALRSSHDAVASRFLADVAKDCNSSEAVRIAAYWALREIQLGLTEEELIMRMIPLMKEALRRLPIGMTEQEVKHTILGAGRFPETLWHSADQIDWDFVDRYASAEGVLSPTPFADSGRATQP